MKYKLKTGDNLKILKNLPDNSIDAVITDPPYGLSFMNKKWDYEVPSVELWKEVLRVLKPGGHLLSFGGTRTYHRLVVNIEDAGFEIRDQIQWIYGSGFPKSLNIGKAVDKITKGNTEYEGQGTGLKPANEPICLARKPISEKTIAENVIKWRTGGLNIDGCRIETADDLTRNCLGLASADNEGWYRPCHDIATKQVFGSTEGRFPANIILECCCKEVIKTEKRKPFSYVGKEYNNKDLEKNRSIDFLKGSKSEAPSNYNDKADIHTNPLCTCYILDEQSGIVNQGPKDKSKSGASRFFYVAKVSKKERNMGLDGFEDKKSKTNQINSENWLHCEAPVKKDIVHKNNHPTVKPINLMTYLCNLITPEGGTILDPFMGSGSTGIAALLQGYNFLGIDMDPEYTKIAEGRISNYEKYRDLLKE